MKMLFSILGVVALYGLAVSGLPQLVGIANQDILNAIDRIYQGNSNFENFETEFGFEGNFETKANPMMTCNYSSFAQAFTQWTVDAKFDQSINYTNNGEALKAAVNAVFKNLDASDSDGAGKAWDSFCIAQRNFFNNIGVFQVANCLLATTLVQNGYFRTDGYQTQQVLTQLNYQCGAAFSRML
ncbi:hypothetical protein FO519_005633 [Halicephalobus sp. NKZ332]|nr:hypothetical protein FO519_005633 [Halicephalobus sp. NKZ332]